MFSKSGDDASSFHVLEESSSLLCSGLVFLPKVPCGQINILLSMHLGTFNFEL